MVAPQDGSHVEMPDRQIAKEAVQHHNVGPRADSDVMQVYSISFNFRHINEMFPNRRSKQWYIEIAGVTTV